MFDGQTIKPTVMDGPLILLKQRESGDEAKVGCDGNCDQSGMPKGNSVEKRSSPRRIMAEERYSRVNSVSPSSAAIKPPPVFKIWNGFLKHFQI